jgi:aryl-alcohol dehydrogenase-like predicted oxidoreductase
MANTTFLPFFLGTGPIGSPDRFDVADAYFDAGGRDFDTARVYGNSEPTLGQWIASRGVADEIRVLSKGAHPDLATWTPRVSRGDVQSDIRQSLTCLGLESVDCYLLHRDDTRTPISEIAQTLASLVADGLTARVGVSNWSAERVAALAEALKADGGPPIAIVSNYYGLAQGNTASPFPGCDTASQDIFDLGRQLGYRVLAWSSQSAGYFSGAAAPEFDSPESRRRRDLLNSVAADHGANPLAVLARWLVTADSILTPVFGTRSPQHVRQLVEWTADTSIDPVVADLISAVGTGIHDPGKFV